MSSASDSPDLPEPGPSSAAARERRAWEDRAVARGALVNGLGVAGKAMVPVFFIVATRLYGPLVAGLYYAAWVVIDVAVSLTVSGINAGVTMFVSRYVEDEEAEDRLYQVLANALVVGFAVSGVCIALVTFGGGALLEGASRPGYDHALQILSLSLPFMVVPVLVVGATKAHLTMTWAAVLQGFLPPLLLTGLAVAFHLAGFGLDGLLYAHVLGYAIVTAVALVVFGRLFSYRRMAGALIRFRWFGPLYAFAIPQNLNMTFNTFITNVDVMMLTWLGYRPELILFYGMGAQIARNVRQVKVSIAGAYAPLIARHHARGETEAMNRSFAMVSRWATTVGVPLVLVAALFRQDLIRLFHGSFRQDPVFMLVLLGLPLLSCTFGIAGNIVVMTGHSLWNLVNSVTVAGLNAVLNYFMIPNWGLMGAATASLVASAVVTTMQIVEANRLVGVRLDLRRIWKPYGAALAPAGILLAASVWGMTGSLGARAGVGVVVLGFFCLGLWLLGLGPEERARLRAGIGRE